MGKKRLQWNKYLKSYFSKLLEDNNIQNLVYEITEEMILSYIYNDSEGCDELTKKFAGYIIKEIGSEAYESRIRFSITSMIRMQKRPKISTLEITRQLANIYKEHLEFNNGFFSYAFAEKNMIEIDVYVPVWNEAYLRAVTIEMAENCYRNVAVNLLDVMVEKLLEMTIDLFNKEHAMKEKNKVNDKIKELTHLKSIIKEFS
jgi:HEPN domain-containing protein